MCSTGHKTLSHLHNRTGHSTMLHTAKWDRSQHWQSAIGHSQHTIMCSIGNNTLSHTTRQIRTHHHKQCNRTGHDTLSHTAQVMTPCHIQHRSIHLVPHSTTGQVMTPCHIQHRSWHLVTQCNRTGYDTFKTLSHTTGQVMPPCPTEHNRTGHATLSQTAQQDVSWHPAQQDRSWYPVTHSTTGQVMTHTAHITNLLSHTFWQVTSTLLHTAYSRSQQSHWMNSVTGDNAHHNWTKDSFRGAPTRDLKSLS